MFQAKGDIPTHLKTRRHQDDKIPAVGTKEWIMLINQSKVEKGDKQSIQKQTNIQATITQPAHQRHTEKG